MRKIVHGIVIVTFITCLLIGIFYYKKLLEHEDLEQESNKQVNNQTSINLENPNDFYNNISLPKITPKNQDKEDIEKIQNNTVQENNTFISDNIINTNSGEIIENQIINDYNNTIEITFLGDVMIGSRVGEAMDDKGQDYVYGGLRDYLSSKDAVVLNLETSVTTREQNVNKTYTFKANPKHLEGLKSFNEKLVANLANNHIGDYTATGVIDTMNYLDQYDIDFFGAGKNKSQADAVKIVSIKGVKLGLIGQTCVNPVSFGATNDLAGNSRFNKETILQEIQTAKNSNADIIVYNMHCGTEYTNGPNPQQTEFAHFAIDNGADLVIGHHPHRYQPVEIYKDSFIFYSLGDTIFDIFRGRRTQEGIMANIIIENKEIISAEIIPTYTQSYGNTVISNERMKEYVLNELYNISKKIGDIPEILEGKIILQN